MQSQGYPVLGTQSTKEFPGLIKFNILENSIEESIPREFLQETEPIFAVICIKFGPMDLYPREKELSRFLEVERTRQIKNYACVPRFKLCIRWQPGILFQCPWMKTWSFPAAI